MALGLIWVIPPCRCRLASAMDTSLGATGEEEVLACEAMTAEAEGADAGAMEPPTNT